MARARNKKAACTAREPMPEYCMEIVGDDTKQAKRIRAKIRRGIQKAADICKISPPVCHDNLGLSRAQMPQITADASLVELQESSEAGDRARARAILAANGRKRDTRTIQDQLLEFLEAKGIRTRRKRVRVGTLKATQAEIKAAKAYGMADSHLRGNFPMIDKQIVVSKDGFILDGHHRWAALLTLDPSRYMSVLEVGLPMAKARGDGPTLLGEAAAFPGVYQATFDGDPLGAAAQRKYKAKHRSGIAAKPKPKRRGPRPVSAATQRRALARAVEDLM